MKIPRIFSIADTVLVKILRFILITVVILTTCTMALQVVLRYVFEVPVTGLDEFAGHTAVWLYMIGAAYASWDKSHIKASALHLVIKNERILLAAKTFASIITIIIAGFMVNWSYGYVQWSIRKHEITPALQLPTIYFQLPIFIASVLMMLYFFIEMVARFDNVQIDEDHYQEPIDD